MHEAFGHLIRELREIRGWSQRDLSSRCEASREAIQRWERAIHSPSLENVIDLAHAFDTTPSKLLHSVEQDVEQQHKAS